MSYSCPSFFISDDCKDKIARAIIETFQVYVERVPLALFLFEWTVKEFFYKSTSHILIHFRNMDSNRQGLLDIDIFKEWIDI